MLWHFLNSSVQRQWYPRRQLALEPFLHPGNIYPKDECADELFVALRDDNYISQDAFSAGLDLPRLPVSHPQPHVTTSLREETGSSRTLLEGWNGQKSLIQAKTSSVFSNEVIILTKISILKGCFAHVQRFLELASAAHGIALMSASGMNRAICPGCLMATDDFVCVARQVAAIRRCAMQTKGRLTAVVRSYISCAAPHSPQLWHMRF